MKIQPSRAAWLIGAVATIALAWTTGATAAHQTYLALGDSLAFGVLNNDTATDISNGDRGYVGPYATILGTVNGGVRPNLIDLGVSGETTTSFFQGGGGINGPDSPLRNTNYPNPPVPQDTLMKSVIAADQAAGGAITTVTIQLGANDLYQMIATTPGFFNLTFAQQAALTLQTIAGVQANDKTLLTELRTLLPNAKLVLMGYYDPYAPFASDPSSPFYALAQASGLAIPILNNVIEGEAAAFNGVYVDEFSAIAGHELAYTYVATGNSHPNLTGYAAITDRLAVSTVPEPASVGLALVGATFLGLVGLARRPRRSADVPDPDQDRRPG